MVEKSDDDFILELESLLKQGGRPRKEEKDSVTLRISAPLARTAKLAYPEERSRIFEEAIIRELRKDGLLPPPLDAVKPKAAKFHGAEEYFNPSQVGKAPDFVLDDPFAKEIKKPKPPAPDKKPPAKPKKR